MQFQFLCKLNAVESLQADTEQISALLVLLDEVALSLKTNVTIYLQDISKIYSN